MSKEIPKKTLKKIDLLIKRYTLFPDDNTYVSFSGGKDSLFLCIALTQLGYKVTPITIDIGFNADWLFAKENLAQFDLELVLIHKDDIITKYPLTRDKLDSNLNLCKTLNNSETICTYCYNSKIIMLSEWATENGVSTIAFGHHGVDVISSFLKSFFMYMDRWYNGNVHYDRNTFYDLIMSYKCTFNMDLNGFLNDDLFYFIKKEFDQNHAGTDEPIRQFLPNRSTILCRPLFSVFESEIISYFEGTNFVFSKGECFSTGNRTFHFLSPREMIQYDLLCNANIEIMNFLLEMIHSSLDANGFLKYNVRKNRNKLLGNAYKNNNNEEKI